jgi:hypothetical protein
MHGCKTRRPPLPAHLPPQIFGSPDIKKAIACLLFGGARKRMPDGTYRRGDINVLLLGKCRCCRPVSGTGASNTETWAAGKAALRRV